MNKQRRKALTAIHTDLSNVKNVFDELENKITDKAELERIRGVVNDAMTATENMRDEEQDYYDNMPEGLQAGDKGSTAEDAIQNLEEAVSQLTEAEELIDEALAKEGEDREAFLEDAIGCIEAAMDEIDNSTSN